MGRWWTLSRGGERTVSGGFAARSLALCFLFCPLVKDIFRKTSNKEHFPGLCYKRGETLRRDYFSPRSPRIPRVPNFASIGPRRGFPGDPITSCWVTQAGSAHLPRSWCCGRGGLRLTTVFFYPFIFTRALHFEAGRLIFCPSVRSLLGRYQHFLLLCFTIQHLLCYHNGLYLLFDSVLATRRPPVSTCVSPGLFPFPFRFPFRFRFRSICV